jgi:hypothetical protein
MDTVRDAVTHKKDSASLKLTPAQRHKYEREIVCYRGMYGRTDIGPGDVQVWAALRAGVPEMAEVDREIAAFRRWERQLWRRSKRRAQSGI